MRSSRPASSSRDGPSRVTEPLRQRSPLARRPRVYTHVGGLTVMVAGLGMIASALVDLANGGPDVVPLAVSGMAVAALGGAAWQATVVPDTLRIRTVFSTVALTWIVVSAVAAIPYHTTGALSRPDNALFEAVSGITTTGASVFATVEGQSAGLLFWRAFTQWMGGLGVVVLAVAVLPFLGAGGMALLRSELPGPASQQLAPRVRDTARRLSVIYAGFTVAVTAAYFLGGMSAYDAATHSFTTVSTGGFSTHDASFGAFRSATLEWVAIPAMLLAGSSFVLLYRAIRRRPGPLLRSVEFRGYVAMMAAAALLLALSNASDAGWTHETVRRSVFTAVSIGSTTGFTTVDFGAWIPAAQSTLVFLMLVGGMTGSTAGGSKVFRLLAAVSYARREVLRHIHPKLVGVVRIGQDVVPEETVSRIIGYHAVFVAVLVVGIVAVASFGLDVLTSVSLVATTLGNVGPGLGALSPAGGYLDIDAGARAVTMALMLLGRLEIYPLLVGAAALGESVVSRVPVRLARAPAR